MIKGRYLGAWAVGAALTLAVVGCGDDTGLGKRYPVTGTVTYKGEPVAKGQINFAPAKPEAGLREANGFIEDGKYSMTTATPGDGVLPGEYNVTVFAKEVDDSKVKETVTQKGGGGRQADIAAANKKGKSLIPPKYQLADTSGLKVTVSTQALTKDFDLTD